MSIKENLMFISNRLKTCAKFVHNLSIFILFYFLCFRGYVAKEIYYPRAEVTVLQSQEQQQLLERYSQQTQQLTTLPKKSIFWPKVKFLKSAPNQQSTPQQLSTNANNLHLSNVYRNSNQQLNAFIRQKQQQQPTMLQFRMTQQQQLQQQQSFNIYQPQNQQHLTNLNQQQTINQKYELPLTPLPTQTQQQLVNKQQQNLQTNYFQQHEQQQQQQLFNFAPIVRYQQQYQMHQPQQSPQLQKQHLQFNMPQMTTTTQQQLQIYSPQPNSYYQFEQKQQQITNLNFIKQPTYTKDSSSFSPMTGSRSDLAISPLLPVYLDEDDETTLLNSNQFCQICCVEMQNPCQRCCETRPLLSATVLKSSVG